MTTEPVANQPEEKSFAPNRAPTLPFPVVGVGGSAGGMEAFSHFLEALPPDPGMAFVLVLHLDPHHESLLTNILSRLTTLPVQEASDGMPVRLNNIYVIPPSSNVALADGHLELRARSATRAPNMPVDHLFRSLANTQRNKSIGVVLSGGGTDGTLGLQEISAEEGITFAQDERTAKHDSMPRSAVASGCIDFVLPPDGIVRELLRIVQHPLAQAEAEGITADEKSTLARIYTLMRNATGTDFSQYKQSTINRRIRRRIALRGLPSLTDYLHYLEQNPTELQALYQDFLIRVTSFFRDPTAFRALQDMVFPRLLQDRPSDAPIRIWVAGCSTGEEVYSIAIALLEFLGDMATSTPVKILATDVSESALEKARAGIYVENIEMDVSPDRLRRFFIRTNSHYQVSKTLRDMCIFSRHNLVRDPPFSRLDLITCRNLLIYLSLTLQKRVIPLFHYALKANGYLMLGNSETIGGFADLFEFVNEKQKIYVRKATAARPPFDFDLASFGTETHLAPGAGERGAAIAPVEVQKEADRLVLQKYGPPGVVVDENLNVLQFRGQTDPYLTHPPGTASLNLLRLAREGLLVELRKALTQVKSEKRAVRKEALLIKEDDQFRTMNLEIIPMRSVSARSVHFLVLFDEVRPPEPILPLPPGDNEPKSETARVAEQRLAQLQQELDATREYLQSVIEEHEATSEELKSAHEEILSNNEELQSTNEELQSAKEEMQSANEELATVNEELKHRNLDLAKANDDLLNLLTGVNIPIVIVSRDLRIRRMTPPAEKVFNLIPTDIGRSLGDIRPNVQVANLDQLIRDVIQTLTPRAVEARDDEGHWYSLRVRPYVTLENKIDGASIVALDIDPIKTNLEQSHRLAYERAARTDAESANRAKDEYLAMLAHELRNPLAPLSNALQLLDHQPYDEQRQKLLDMATRQTRQMARLLDDLLDAARLEQGKIQQHKQPVELGAAVARAVESVRSPIEVARHELSVDLPPGPLWLEVDPLRVEQILTNLLHNAAKYTPPGGRIELNAAWGDKELILRVKDTGIGISAEMLPQVFDLFRQAEETLDRARGGLGIGLTLVKRLVELHGGTVEALSEGDRDGEASSSSTCRLSPEWRRPRRVRRNRNLARSRHAACFLWMITRTRSRAWQPCCGRRARTCKRLSMVRGRWRRRARQRPRSPCSTLVFPG